MASYRSTGSFGRRQEYMAFAELLRRGYDVYATLVDDQQIDCVLRLDQDDPVYIDIQIKARSKDAKHGATFAALTIKKPRPNFFYIFYSESAERYWVVPSIDLVKMANQNKGGANNDGKNKGKYTIKLAARRKAGSWHSAGKWLEYESNFDLLNSVGKKLVMPPKKKG